MERRTLERHVGKDKRAHFYVYVLEAVVIFDNGITLPFISEFLNNADYRDVSSDKQDCEQKAFYRFAERIKKRFPKLMISVTMDGLYACGPVIKTCRGYGWDFMFVFKEGAMKDAWREGMGLIKLTPENNLNGLMMLSIPLVITEDVKNGSMLWSVKKLGKKQVEQRA